MDVQKCLVFGLKLATVIFMCRTGIIGFGLFLSCFCGFGIGCGLNNRNETEASF